ncbi:MAG: NFACT family protein [Candidatus Obscuribacterales bacterium]|nr:NFACT family protein [Candidatus Obscuribacterales bacterium]
MQAVDALTLKAVVEELKLLLTKARLDKSQQTARDELCLTFRQTSGQQHLLLSANTAMGRICLLEKAKTSKLKSQSAFGLALKKHLVSAQLLSISAVDGERIVDLVFSSVDELGSRSTKVLTVEIMGKHSNLIFWDKESEKIIAASHNVTAAMSSKREIASGLRYVRPPKQNKLNIFCTNFEEVAKAVDSAETVDEDFLLSKFSGLGRPLAEELASQLNESEDKSNQLWKMLKQIQKLENTKPAMRLDLTKYSIFSWSHNGDDIDQWQEFKSANELVATYYQQLEDRVSFNQAREELRSLIRTEEKRLSSRLAVSVDQRDSAAGYETHKQYGDLLLANIANITVGQEEVTVSNFYADDQPTTIALDPSLSPSQNAQVKYKLFSKNKARFEAAEKHIGQTSGRLAVLKQCLADLGEALTRDDVDLVKANFAGRDPTQSKILNKDAAGGKPIMFGSSDGVTILVGRNRKENELILSNAKPHEIWLHVLGSPGSHVLIRLTSNKTEPPANTLKEAAYAAAYFSKAKTSGITRVTYTQCRYVKKLGPAGVVSYEKEKTVEVDLADKMPQGLKDEIVKRQMS